MAKEQEPEFTTQSWYIPRDPKKNPAEGINGIGNGPVGAGNDSLISGGSDSLTSGDGAAEFAGENVEFAAAAAGSSAANRGEGNPAAAEVAEELSPYPTSYLPRRSDSETGSLTPTEAPLPATSNAAPADQALPVLSEAEAEKDTAAAVAEEDGPAWDGFYANAGDNPASPAASDSTQKRSDISKETPTAASYDDTYETAAPSSYEPAHAGAEESASSSSRNRGVENPSPSTQELPVTPDLDAAMTGPAPSEYQNRQSRKEESTTEQRVSLLQDYHKANQGPSTDPNLTPTWNNFPEDQEVALAANPPKLSLDEAIFEGATVTPTVPSRLTAHLWSALLYLILLPLTWYYCVDAGSRLAQDEINPWMGGAFTTEVRVEIGIAAVGILVLLWLARYSSLGAFLLGIFSTVISLPYFFVPGRTQAIVGPFLKALAGSGDPETMVEIIRANLAHNLEISFSYGIFLWMGLVLIGVGLVSHGARRKGRKDYLLEEKIEQANLA